MKASEHRLDQKMRLMQAKIRRMHEKDSTDRKLETLSEIARELISSMIILRSLRAERDP